MWETEMQSQIKIYSPETGVTSFRGQVPKLWLTRKLASKKKIMWNGGAARKALLCCCAVVSRAKPRFPDCGDHSGANQRPVLLPCSSFLLFLHFPANIFHFPHLDFSFGGFPVWRAESFIGQTNLSRTVPFSRGSRKIDIVSRIYFKEP